MSILRCMVLTAFSFIFAGQVFAQNLITNGGFENAGNPGLGVCACEYHPGAGHEPGLDQLDGPASISAMDRREKRHLYVVV